MEEVNVTNAVPMEYTPPGNHTNKNANRNIITLTLKNNQLIVETEERAVSILEISNERAYFPTIYSFRAVPFDLRYAAIVFDGTRREIIRARGLNRYAL